MTRLAVGNKGVGAQGEQLVAERLIAQGWTILDRNWRCSIGEIDIIAQDPDGVVALIEVKARTGMGYGAPLESITYAKQRRLRQLAGVWLSTHSVERVRIDAVGVVLRRGYAPVVQHVRGIE
ncbi:MAG: YraN family protein [Propionibacteriales bacterium]|nr:YraN family protein [Propionibacteriales bacterium]